MSSSYLYGQEVRFLCAFVSVKLDLIRKKKGAYDVFVHYTTGYFSWLKMNHACFFETVLFLLFFKFLRSHLKIAWICFFGTYIEQCYKVGSINCFLISYMDQHFCMLEHSTWLIGLDSDTYLAFQIYSVLKVFNF